MRGACQKAECPLETYMFHGKQNSSNHNKTSRDTYAIQIIKSIELIKIAAHLLTA